MSRTSLLRVADLPNTAPTLFDLRPDSAQCAALGDELGLLALRKVRLRGQIAAQGPRDWVLSATLGATVVQGCVVTLDPVTTRLDVPVRRLFVADYIEPEESEAEIPEDETCEPLRETIALDVILQEALVLHLPLYPRAPGAQLQEAHFSPPGTDPLSDETARPFAGLAALRDTLHSNED